MRVIILFLLSLFIFSCGNSSDKKISVAVANNMQYAMDEIVLKFEEKYGIDVDVSSGSSGTITSQIQQGAPYDVFISANMKYPKSLYIDKLTVDSPQIYAHGSLVLWTLKDIDINNGLKSLLDNGVQKIAIANPETAPYGIAAMEALNNAKLFNTLNPKIVYGEGVSQVNQYVKSLTVDVGITSKSVIFSPKLRDKGTYFDVDKNLYKQIEQGIVILKRGKEKNFKNAELFYNFMFSPEVKIILTNFGYDSNALND